MHILSVNIGLPREASWDGKTLTTGIFKRPVAGPVAVRRLGLVGDGQADPSVHGGEDQAVYVYPSEHYAYWQDLCPDLEFPPGFFGENLSTRGLLEDAASVGDRFRFGEAELEVTCPRQPCNKLEMRFGKRGVARQFSASGRTGIYLRVIREGEVSAGDPIEVVSRDAARFTITAFNRLCSSEPGEVKAETLRRAVSIAALPEDWRARFRRRLERLERA